MGPKSRCPWLSPGKQHLGFCIHENIRKMVPQWNVHFSVGRARLCSCLLTLTVWQDWAYCSPVERHLCPWVCTFVLDRMGVGGRGTGVGLRSLINVILHVMRTSRPEAQSSASWNIRKTAVNYYYYFTFHFSRGKWHPLLHYPCLWEPILCIPDLAVPPLRKYSDGRWLRKRR